MTDISHLHVPVNDVIIIKDDAPSESFMDDLSQKLHERFPSSLVVWMGKDDSFETMQEDELRMFLEALIEHREARP